MTEEASEGLPSNDEFVRKTGLWMTKYLIDTGLVPRARSLIERTESGGFGKRSHEFTAPIHNAAVLGDLRKWANSVENLSRRVSRSDNYWRTNQLSNEEVYRLTVFVEAIEKECEERRLDMEDDVLSQIDSMSQHLHFSVAHKVAREEDIEDFYTKLVQKHGFDPEPPEYEEDEDKEE